MLMKADRAVLPTSTQRVVVALAMFVAGVLIAFLVFIVMAEGKLGLWHRWTTQEEYSHGFLIPVISAWLLWTRRKAIAGSIGAPSLFASWSGLALILLAAALLVVGKLGSLFLLPEIGFVLALVGLVLCAGGLPLFKVTWLPIAFLLFAIPLPYVVDAGLSLQLQLLSSQLGVAFIRLFDIPVYLEGNVIDLGAYKLQVVDACSGLRYLYPLMSLGFLAAYLFQAPPWQRAIVFLSTIPITILMNSLRIGLVGILVDHFGPQDAEGFVHMFEGWVIFLACAVLLAGIIFLLARISGKSFSDVFHPPKIEAQALDRGDERDFAPHALVACLALLCVTAVVGLSVTARQQVFPARKSFMAFPTTLGDWQGRPSSLDPQIEHGLGLTDYILANYVRGGGPWVNLYVAYYANQRDGAAPHSPAVCIPGNGWGITELTRTHYASADGSVSLPFNRVVIGKNTSKQLVYYWFEERGMKIANEYWSKLYLLRDALVENRTDGALVRLTTPIMPGEAEAEADKRLQEFMRVVVPQLAVYLPAAPGATAKTAAAAPTMTMSRN